MSKPFERVNICDGVHFSSVTDPKFKHNSIVASLVLKLDRDTVTANAIVPFILRKGCESCPDFTKLNQKLCALYGASLSCDVSKFGGYQVLDLSIYGVDDRFTLDDEAMTRECALLLTEILLRPRMENNVFDATDVALEKQQLIDTIESQINDKRSYAMSKCKSIMCAGEDIAVEKYGYIADAEQLTPETAADAYRAMIRTAQIEVMFVGCGNPDIAKRIFTDAFARLERAPIAVQPVMTRRVAAKINAVTEELEVAQSKLVMGFRTGEIADRRAFGAMRMMVALFGGTPNSRLFVYVREKLSLCYYCAARFDRLTGLMFVDSGVEKENKQKAYDEILRQLDVVRAGGFTDEELTTTRLLMQNSLRSVTDSLGAIAEWYLTQVMADTCLSPAEESALLDEITRDDIIAAAGRVTLDTVYFLTGKESAI